MTRLIFILTLIAVLSLAVGWVADEPGFVAIDWAQYHIETSVAFLLAAVTLLSLAAMGVYWLLFRLIRAPKYYVESRRSKRQGQGLEALTETFAAIATRDLRTAKKQIARAQYLLPNEPLTLMLSAQVANLEGNEGQARLHLERMLSTPNTEFMALRGLIENARRKHDDEAALHYAEKAARIRPSDTWLISVLVGIYVSKARIQQALQWIEKAYRQRHITKIEARRLSAVALYEHAMRLLTQQHFESAFAALQESVAKAPDFIPAVIKLAELYMQREDTKAALKIIIQAWKVSPHPHLILCLEKFYEANRDRKKIVAAAEKLSELHPEHRETRFLLAMMAIKRRDWSATQNYVQHLLREKETTRACALMAELEEQRGNADEASRWLKRAVEAAPDAAYICEACNHHQDHWSMACERCGSNLSLTWK